MILLWWLGGENYAADSDSHDHDRENDRVEVLGGSGLQGAPYLGCVEREDISELHFICPIPNVVSILDHRIVSHTKAKRLSHESIADPEVQERRSKVKVPNGMKLHDYANLYFNGRNSMMFAVVTPGGSDGICLLRVDLNVLDLPDVVITDCNAASNYVRFFDLDVGFQNIDHDEIFSVSWNHPDYFTRTRHRSRMCAEVLVPHRGDPSLILGAFVGSRRARRSLNSVAPSLNVTVDMGIPPNRGDIV